MNKVNDATFFLPYEARQTAACGCSGMHSPPKPALTSPQRNINTDKQANTAAPLLRAILKLNSSEWTGQFINTEIWLLLRMRICDAFSGYVRHKQHCRISFLYENLDRCLLTDFIYATFYRRLGVALNKLEYFLCCSYQKWG